jgi:hypothetical protein
MEQSKRRNRAGISHVENAKKRVSPIKKKKMAVAIIRVGASL